MLPTRAQPERKRAPEQKFDPTPAKRSKAKHAHTAAAQCDCPPPPCDCDWYSDCETDYPPPRLDWRRVPYPRETGIVPTDTIARDERRRKRKRGASGAHEPASDSCRASRPVRRARRTRRPAVAVGCSGVPARRHPQILPRAIRRTAHTAAAAVRHVLGERAAELAVALAPGTVALRAVDAQHGQCPRGAGGVRRRTLSNCAHCPSA